MFSRLDGHSRIQHFVRFIHGYTRIKGYRSIKLHNKLYKFSKNPESLNHKPKAGDYFTKLEIATLFLQPMGLILLYFGLSWKLFQYVCDVSSPSELSNSILWLVNKGTPPERYTK